MRYLGIVRKSRDSDYSVEFPDIPGCYSAGSSLDELEDMAGEALALHLEVLQETISGPLPTASSLSEIEGIIGTCRGEDFFALIPFSVENQDRAKRINITISSRLLSRIDHYVDSMGISRSGFLADAALAELEKA